MSSAGPRRRFAGGLGSHLVPALIVVGVLVFVGFAVLAPGVAILRNSLTDAAGHFSGRVYLDTLTRPGIVTALGNTAIVVFGSVLFALVTGIGLAWCLERTDIPFARLLSTTANFPLVFPPIVGAVAWVLLLGPKSGLINVGLAAAHLGQINLYNVWGITWVVGIYTTPYVFLVVASSFRQYDASYEEAARTAGTRLRTILWRITLPMLTPAILAGALLAFVSSMAMFVVPEIIGGPAKVQVLTTIIYNDLNEYPRDLKSAAVLSTVMVVATLVVLWSQRRMLRVGSRFVTMSGKGVRGTRLPLRRWRWAAFTLVACYVVVTTVLPMLALVSASLQRVYQGSIRPSQFTTANFAALFDSGNGLAWASIRNSGYLSLIGATIGMLVAVLVARTVVHVRSRAARLLDYLSTVPAALPATVLGAGLIMIYLGPPFALYGTNALLIIAYVAHHLPQGVRTASSAFHQVSGDLDEAAYVCGSPWTRTFRRITLPVIAPALASGWLFLFILMSREASASALVASPRTPVVSTVVLDLWGYGDVPRLSAFSVLIVALSAALTALVVRVGARSGVRTA